MPAKLFNSKQDQQIKEYYLLGATTQTIADIFGCYKQSVLTSLKRTGTPRRKNWNRASGQNSGRWKGGKRMISGYLHLLAPGHRLARKDGYVAEHRYMMERFITKKSQVVHHKDENRLNNNITNLEVLENNGVHRRLHTKTQVRNRKGKFYKI